MTSLPWQIQPAEGLSALPAEVDIIIIGAGLAGLACAARLAESGAEVLVMESRSSTCPGPDARTDGLVIPGLADSAHRLSDALGLEDCTLLFDLARRGQQRLSELDVFEATGVTLASLSDNETDALSRDEAVYASLGWRTEPFTPSESLRARGLMPGLRLPEAGVVDPCMALAALRDQATRHGVTICYDSTVQEVETIDGAVRVHSQSTSVDAEMVIYTAGWSMVSWLPWAREKLFPVRLQHQTLERSPPIQLDPMVLQYGHSWVRAVGDRILTGGCRWATPHLEVGESDEESLSQPVEDRAHSRARALFSPDVPLHRCHRWAQVSTFTCDGLPFVGPLPGSARQLICTGWNGRPWSMALAAGESVAAGVMGEDAAALPQCLSSYRMI